MDDEIGKRIGSGNTAEVFLWESGKILKLFRTGLPREVIKEEFEQTCKIYEVAQICPQPFELILHDDRYGIVYEKITGVSMLSQITGKFWTAKNNARKLARLQAQFNQETVDHMPTVVERLKRNIGMVTEFTCEEKDALYSYIDSLPTGSSLCHLDYHPGNVILAKDRSVVIDWMTAAVGNPLADVCRTIILLELAETGTTSPFIGKLISFARKRIACEYRDEYLSLVKADPGEIDAWRLPIMAARLMEWVSPGEKAKLLANVKIMLSNQKKG